MLIEGGPNALDGYIDGYSLYEAYFIPNELDPSGMIEFDPSQIPKGLENLKRAIMDHGDDWGRKAYDWARKHDKALAKDIQWAQKHAKVRNVAKRTKGAASAKLLGAIAVGACEIACYVKFKQCVDAETADFDAEIEVAEFMINKNRPGVDAVIDNAETAALAGYTACGTRYAICALSCLCFLSLFQ